MAPKKNGKNKKWYIGAQNVAIGSGSAPGGKRGVMAAHPQHTPQKYKQLNKGDQVIEQDEVIGTVTGNTTFDTSRYQIQPGQVAIFPWLAQVAGLYERYKFDYLEFYYKPTVSAYSTSGQTGKVILSADFDSVSPEPQSYRDAETMDPHADCMPYETCRLRLDPRRLTPGVGGKFVRSGTVPVGTDIKTYDAGSLFFSVDGTQDTNNIGELRVKYKVRFMNPRLDGSDHQPPNHSFSFTTVDPGAAVTSGTETLLGLADFTVGNNGLGILKDSGVTEGQMTMKAGIQVPSAKVLVAGNTGTAHIEHFSLYWKINGSAITYGSSTYFSNAAASSVYKQTLVIPPIPMNFSEGDSLGLYYQLTLGSGTATMAGYISVLLG